MDGQYRFARKAINVVRVLGRAVKYGSRDDHERDY